jgi:AcrR family transcriptional regulator
MPVFVDHEERRQLVIAVASRLIATAGLEAVTIRDVAEAANCSTAIVSHYFRNKRELLILTYNSSLDVAQARCDHVLASGPDDLRGYLAELMPLDDERMIEWKIWLAFWARAVADPEIAEIQRGCVVHARSRILDVLGVLNTKGVLALGLDLEKEARQLLVLVMGLALQAMFDPADWPAQRQLELIDAELQRLHRPSRMAPPSHGAEAPLERA